MHLLRTWQAMKEMCFRFLFRCLPSAVDSGLELEAQDVLQFEAQLSQLRATPSKLFLTLVNEGHSRQNEVPSASCAASRSPGCDKGLSMLAQRHRVTKKDLLEKVTVATSTHTLYYAPDLPDVGDMTKLTTEEVPAWTVESDRGAVAMASPQASAGLDDDEDPELATGPDPSTNPFSPGGTANASNAANVMSLSQSDLVLMMRQMMEVTQAASTAAQAALAATKDAGKSGLAGADMARLLPKPDVFKPANREAEHGEWSAWLWTLKQYLGALDVAFTDELTFIERNPTRDLSGEPYASLESERRSKQLFALLSSLIKGRGLQIIQRIPVQNGFEALRQLVQLYQPASKTRSLGILSALTSMGHFRAGEPLLPQVLDMERIMDEYERSSSKKLDDDFKSSIFLRSVSSNMRNHLATVLNEDVTYSTLRETALHFERMNTKWDSKNLFAGDSLFSKSRSSNDGPVPMEVDALQRKGKGKGDKGKHKGKYDKQPGGKGTKGEKGKGKGKQQPDGKGIKSEKGGKGNQQQKGGSWNQQQKGGNWNQQQKGGSWNQQQKGGNWNQQQKGGNWNRVHQVQGAGSDVGSTSVPSTVGPSASQAPQAGNVHRVQLGSVVEVDMTEEELSIQYLDAPASVRAVRRESPGEARLDGGHAAQGLLGFRDLVKVLGLNPHGYPKLPNLQPVPAAEHYNIASTDDDDQWTTCLDDAVDLCSAASEPSAYLPDSALPDLEEAIESLNAAPAARDLCAVRRGHNSGEASPGVLPHEAVDIEVVVDSGADASCLSMSWAQIGKSGGADKQWYRDAQGNRIAGRETRTATIEIGGVKFREQWLLSTVTQPLFCVGKLMKKNGWDIVHDTDKIPHLTSPDGNVRVPMFYKNYSLRAKGFIRGLSVPHLSLGVRYRTTLVSDGTAWNVVELNQDLSLLDQPEAEFEPKELRQVITIVSCDKVDIDVLFNQRAPSPAGDEDANMSEKDLAEVPHDFLDEIFDDINEGRLFDEAGEPRFDPPGEPSAAAPGRGHIVVDGVELHEGCNLKTLRAACTALGIGRSGGKATVLSRIASHLDKLRLLEKHQVEHDSLALEREPRQQAPVAAPTPEQIRLHQLNHIPYQPWCEHCIKYQARADKHVKARPETRQCSVCSFDYCFTERPHGERGEKLICLIVKDSHTSACAAIPTPAKGGPVAFRLPFALMESPRAGPLQQGVKDLRDKLKLTTHLEQTEKGDHQGNPAEQTVNQIRQLAGTLLSQLEEETGQHISTNSPVHAWAFRHASWLLTRYARTESQSAFELITGRPYLGKLVNFGEVVYARVKSSVKGRPRWVKIMWLGKLAVSDLHFGVSQGGFLISSRSVRRLPKQYDAAFLSCTYDMPWTQASFLAGQSGQARKQKSTDQGPERNADEAVPEVVVNEGPQAMPYPGYVVPDNTPLIELLPPPPLMRTPEPPTPSNPSAVTPAHMLPSLTPVPPETASPVPMFVEPSASAPAGGATAGAGGSNEGPASSGVVRARPADAPADAPAPTRTKRLRLDAVQTDASGNQLVHQDEDVTLEGEAAEEFLDCGEATDGVDYESAAAPEIPSCLIRPFSESEPTCSPAELDGIDRVADEFEFDRLVQLGVMTEVADKLDGHRMLTTKSVRTWRPKVLAGQKVWLRRSRLVAREYAHLDPERSGLFCPTTSQIMLRVIPSLFLRRRDAGWSLLSLDVSDAFLQCEQQHQTLTRIGSKWFKLLRMLPGQCDGSVTWCNDFTNEMKAAVGVELLPESPALFRLPASAGGGYVHVDDMLCGGVTAVLERLEQHLASKFKISSEWLREVGDEVSFLKRRLDKLLEVTGLSRGNHRSKGTPFPTSALPTEQTSDKPLDSATATRFRSAVGILMYMSSNLIACQYGIRYLSTYAHAPTEGAWKLLRHLTSYVSVHRSHCIGLSKPELGKGLIQDKSSAKSTSLLEVLSDSDWSGCKRTRKSVSSCAILWDNMHISGKLLWLQQLTKDEVLQVAPVATAVNASDIGTKPLKADRVNRLLGMLGIRNADDGYSLVGESQLLEHRERMQICRVVKQGPLSAQQVIQVLALLLQVDRVTSAESEPNTQNNSEDALGQNGDAPDDNFGLLEHILEWIMYGFFLVRDFAVDYPTTIILALQICVLCMLCFTLCRRGRVHQLRQHADDQPSAVPTVAVHVKVEGAKVTVGNPEPAETLSNPVDSLQANATAASSAAASSAAASSATASSATARADDHDVRSFRAVPVASAAPGPAARPTVNDAVWVTKAKGRSFHQKRSCGTLGNAKSLEQITKSEALRRGFKPCKVCCGR
ncbi:GIP [Symbiodinium sp. KB8]|nr:GIP [Symbiodinium sp. KB8]